MSLSGAEMCRAVSGRCGAWFRRWLRRVVIAGSILVLALLVYVAAGFGLARIPTNTDFQTDPHGVEIAVVHNGLHTDVVLPLVTPQYDWWECLSQTDFPYDVAACRYVSFGWGNRAFYLETPTWSDVHVTTVFKAMVGMGGTVLHADLLYDLPPASERCRRIWISATQHARLVEYVRHTLALRDDGRARVIPDAGYYVSDAFYEATGHYSLFRTCNVWTGDALRAAGVRVGWWTPFAGGVFSQLPAATVD